MLFTFLDIDQRLLHVLLQLAVLSHLEQMRGDHVILVNQDLLSSAGAIPVRDPSL